MGQTQSVAMTHPPPTAAAPVRPFDTLPDELLILVFESFGDIIGPPPPFNVTWVCRRWRYIALSTPRLWASIAPRGEAQMECLDGLLALAGSERLSVDLDVSDMQLLSVPFAAAFAFLCCNLSRTSRLRLGYLPGHDSLLKCVLRTNAPVLEELVLRPGGMQHTGPLAPSFPAIHNAPALRTLDIGRMHVSPSAISAHSHLCELVLSDTAVVQGDLFGLLGGVPALCTLDLRNVNLIDDFALPSGTITPPLLYPSLRHLRVCHTNGGRWGRLVQFLNRIDLTAVVRIDFELSTYGRFELRSGEESHTRMPTLRWPAPARHTLDEKSFTGTAGDLALLGVMLIGKSPITGLERRVSCGLRMFKFMSLILNLGIHKKRANVVVCRYRQRAA